MIIPHYSFDDGNSGERQPRGTARTYMSHEMYVIAQMNSDMVHGEALTDRAAEDPRGFFRTYFRVPYDADGADGMFGYKDDGVGYDIDSRQLGVELADQLAPSVDADPDIVPIDFELRKLPPGFDVEAAFAEGDHTAVMERLLQASRVMVAFTLEPPNLA